MSKKEISILIVDDEQSVRKFLATCLSLDYGCALAETAEEAIEMVSNQFFHVVVTDVSLPGISGIKLCEEIRRICPDTVVIAMSGVSDIRARVEAIRQGALYFIEKPFSTSGVQKLVEAALSSQAAAVARRKTEWSSGDTFSIKTDNSAIN